MNCQKKSRSPAHLLLMALVFSSYVFCSKTSFAGTGFLQSGVYEIRGEHSLLGPYRGKLLVKEDHSVQRYIQLQVSPSKNNENVLGLISSRDEVIEQLWEGKQLARGLSFDILPSKVLTSANETFASKEQLKTQKIEISDVETEFTLPLDGSYHEQYQYIGPQDTDLFTKENIQYEDAYGVSSSALVNLAMKLGINKAVDFYRQIPELNEWKDKPEFKANKQFRIKDFTDLDFYRQNKDMLRLRNVSINAISLAEAQERRLAFSPTLKQKAEWMDQSTSSLNLNELGLLEIVQLDESDVLTQRIPDHDSALWTGIYAWSQLLRYRTTGEEVSYQNFKKAIVGLTHLLKISDDPKQFARYIFHSPRSEITKIEGVKQGQGFYSQYKYHAGSNNDMAKGILLGFTLAYQGLRAEDGGLRQDIANLLPKLIATEAIAKNGFNLGLAKGLDAIYNGRLYSVQEYSSQIANMVNYVGDIFSVSAGFHVGGLEDASGNHLTMVSSVIQLMLADIMLKRPEFAQYSPGLKWAYNEAIDNMRGQALRMRKAHHGYLDLVAYAVTKDKSFKDACKEAIDQLIEIPMGRPVGNLTADLAQRENWIASSWPGMPWKALRGPFVIDKGNLKDIGQRRGVYGYPAYQGDGLGSSYVWKDSANFYLYKGDRQTQKFYADYLWAYWLARSSGVID